MPLMKSHRPNFHTVTTWISEVSTEPEATEFDEWSVPELTQGQIRRKRRESAQGKATSLESNKKGQSIQEPGMRGYRWGRRAGESRISRACSWDSGRPKAASGCPSVP